MPTKPVRLPAILAAAGVDSQLELLLLNRIEHAGLPVGEAGQQIIPGRKFEFDRVWRQVDGRPIKVCVEVQGGVHSRMGHSTGVGIERDCEKSSLAAAHGWLLLQVTEKQIKSGQAVTWIAQALGVKAE